MYLLAANFINVPTDLPTFSKMYLIVPDFLKMYLVVATFTNVPTFSKMYLHVPTFVDIPTFAYKTSNNLLIQF